MSTNIENSVVSMSFDNANFERNAKTTMSTLDKLRKALDFSGSAKTLNDVSYAAGQWTCRHFKMGYKKFIIDSLCWK